MRFLARVTLAAATVAALAAAHPALANPYVWVTVNATIDYSAIGVPTAISYAWHFDKAFSGFAAAGLDGSGDGRISAAKLAGAAKINIAALAAHDYFTHVSAGGHPVSTGPARDESLASDDGTLTLRFTLPLLHAPASEVDPLQLKVYDPSYFVAFTLAPGDPVKLSEAPPACVVATARGHRSANAGNLATKLDLASRQGEHHADTATVACAGEALAFAAPTPGSQVRFPPLSPHTVPATVAPGTAPPTPRQTASPVTSGTATPHRPGPDSDADAAAARVTAALVTAAQRPLRHYDAPPPPVVTAATTPVRPATNAAPPAPAAPHRAEVVTAGFSIRGEQLLIGLGILGLGAALLGSLLLRGSLLR